MVAKLGLFTATTVIITNMVGTGVFTSLGFQLEGTSSGPAIILLWILGGITALSGAAVYSELAGHFPRSGGEYNFLSKIYHPSVGFLAGWVSITVGFAAPIALCAKAFGTYFSRVSGVNSDLAAITSLLLITAAHMMSVRKGALLQNVVTILELALMLVFIITGFPNLLSSSVPFTSETSILEEMFNAPFAVSLIYVFFAYSGWNAAAYITGEVNKPRRNIPIAMIGGTVGIMVLYILLNMVFMSSAPQEELQGVLEVGHVSAVHIFGPNGAILMSSIISIALLASMSGMTLAGPRVMAVMAEDYPVFRGLFSRNRWGSPYLAVCVQSSIALVLVLTSTFEKIMVYIGFTLSLCTTMTVLGLFVLRRRKVVPKNIVRCFGYPITPVVFLLMNLWMMIYTLYKRPFESLGGLGTIVIGIAVYFLLRRSQYVSHENKSST